MHTPLTDLQRHQAATPTGRRQCLQDTRESVWNWHARKDSTCVTLVVLLVSWPCGSHKGFVLLCVEGAQANMPVHLVLSKVCPHPGR